MGSYSGQETLSAINRSLHEIRSQVSQADNQLEHYNGQMFNFRRQESDTYRQLALIKLNQLQAEQFSQQLSYAEKQAIQLLQQRNRQIEITLQAVTSSQQLQMEQDQERNQQAVLLDQSIDELETSIEQALEQLSAKENYQALQVQAQNLVNMASNAQLKTEQAEQEKVSKGQPYRDDKFFMYLWKRHYGTSNYKANFIARFFDKKIADHLHYDQARINFYSLNNIPKRLAEHTANLEQEAEDAMQQLKKLEREAEISAGAEQLEKEVDTQRESLAKLDKKITLEEDKFNQLLKQRQNFEQATDQYMRKAIDTLVESFKADPIPQLRQEAKETQSLKDDHLISQLAELRNEIKEVKKRISQSKNSHSGISKKMQELEEVRRKFKRMDYDATNSKFSDSGQIANLLAMFLANRYSANDIWKLLKKQQRFIRRRHTNRYGGMGLPGSDFPINIPGSRRSSRRPRGINFPSGWGGSGSSGGGGGFKTGGGF